MFNFKATGIIVAAFNDEEIKHFVVMHGKAEAIHVPFPIIKGPMVDLLFISNDDDNDVSIRVVGLINRIQKADRFRVLLTLNKLNCAVRFAKYCMDDSGNINVEYDFLENASEAHLGSAACEAFYRMAQIINDNYEELVRAIYSDHDEEPAQEAEPVHEAEPAHEQDKSVEELMDELMSGELGDLMSQARRDDDDDDEFVWSADDE